MIVSYEQFVIYFCFPPLSDQEEKTFVTVDICSNFWGQCANRIYRSLL